MRKRLIVAGLSAVALAAGGVAVLMPGAFATAQPAAADPSVGEPIPSDDLPSEDEQRAAYAEILRKQRKIEQAQEQQNIMHSLNSYESESWELAMKMKNDDAASEATRRGLIPPDKLWPVLARGLVNARAFHYLK